MPKAKSKSKKLPSPRTLQKRVKYLEGVNARLGESNLTYVQTMQSLHSRAVEITREIERVCFIPRF